MKDYYTKLRKMLSSDAIWSLKKKFGNNDDQETN